MPLPDSDLQRVSSLEQVVVPANVQPGGSFDVLLCKVQRGVEKTVRKTLWRASGCAPELQRQQPMQLQGARHSHRPSAKARRTAGRCDARAIDDFCTVPAVVQSYESSQELAARRSYAWLMPFALA